MVTGYEVEMYHNIGRIAAALESAAKSLASIDQAVRGIVAPPRVPYVGEGVDGLRRSAQIDRAEADGLDRANPRRAELLASARRWDTQAAALLLGGGA